MATEFPPNLDDGELWLPSDIIPELGYRRQVSSGPDIEALAKQLAAFGLLNLYPNPNRPVPAVKPLPDLAEGFRPATRFGFGYEEYRVPSGTAVAYQQLNSSKPVHAQVVDGFGQERSRALQRQQQNAGPARLFPFRVNGSARSCGGTGVFLPRVINNEVRKKPASRKVGEQRPQPMRSTVSTKQMQVMPLIQPQAELTLPQEWSY